MKGVEGWMEKYVSCSEVQDQIRCVGAGEGGWWGDGEGLGSGGGGMDEQEGGGVWKKRGGGWVG